MEAKLNELVARLKAASGSNLKTVVLYGSAVTGEFHPKHSDLNIFCLVERTGVAELAALHETVDWWTEQANPIPQVFTFEELARSADVFAIELLDMKLHHRILYGDDFFESLEVPLRLHGMQVERELRTSWLRLRRAILAAPRKKKAYLAIMLSSVATFSALFRHALVALGRPMPATRREAVDGLAQLAGGDPSAFHAILDLREGKGAGKRTSAESVLHTYLEFVEVVTNEVDRRLDAL